MALSVLLFAFSAIALIFGAMTGTLPEVGRAVTEGADKAIEVGLSLAGMLCLWGGLTEVMRRAGLMQKLSRLLGPALRLLFPSSSKDTESMESISANVAANVLGLGNAATPLSIRAVTRLRELAGGSETASDAVITLMILNCSSLQLIPATIAGVRGAAGAENPFDILVPVWIASAISCALGIVLVKAVARLQGRR